MSGNHIKTPAKRAIKNPGAARFNQVYSKRNPRPIADWSDQDLLAILLSNPQAAETVMAEIGELGKFSKIGEGASLTHLPGISKGTALKLDAIFEVACRLG